MGFSAGDPRNGRIRGLFVQPIYESNGTGQILIAAACRSLRDVVNVSVSNAGWRDQQA
jgi:hypothetical protein